MALTRELQLGERLYNRGDVCNRSHWATVTKVSHGRFGTDYELTPDEKDGWADSGKPYWICPTGVHEVDKGHGGTRIVTEAAYHALRAERIAAMQNVVVP